MTILPVSVQFLGVPVYARIQVSLIEAKYEMKDVSLWLEAYDDGRSVYREKVWDTFLLAKV